MSFWSRIKDAAGGLLTSLPGYFGRRETQSYWPNRAQRIVYVQSTIAGIRVTPDTALQSAVVWACVNVVSKSIAMLPWRVMRQIDPKTSVIVPGTIDDILNSRPNPEMSAFTFRQTMVGHLLTWGDCYAEIERDAAGRPVGLWPIEPDRVFVKRWFDTNRLYYMVNNQTKGIVNLDVNDMFHVKGLSFDGITGYRTVGYAAQSIGLAMAIERFGAGFFGNNCQLGGTIESPNSNLSPEAKDQLEASFNERHQGPDRAFKVKYLDNGMKFSPVTVEPDKGQFIASREHQIEEICRWFGVPPHKVAHLERSTNNNIEHQGIEFVQDGILPLTVNFQQEANFKLGLTRGLYTRFDTRELTRGDTATRQAYYSSMRDRGVMSANDIRYAEGDNPIPDKDGGNKYFVAVNMQLMGTAGDASPEPPPSLSKSPLKTDRGGNDNGEGDSRARTPAVN